MKVEVALADLAAFFSSKRRKTQAAVKKGMEPGLKQGVRWARSNKGFRLGAKKKPPIQLRITNRTGTLRNTVDYWIGPAKRLTGNVEAGLKMKGPQARILEKGGRTGPHTIVPKKAMYLTFYWPKVGHWVSLKRVNHPGSVFEPRPVLGRALTHVTPRILRDIKKEIRKTLIKKSK